MIIRGGENIYPAELEAVLHEHPAVAEAAVVGVPDDVYGENVVAFVVSKPGAAVSEMEVVEHVCRHLAKFKSPSRVHFLAALPKSNIGKILAACYATKRPRNKLGISSDALAGGMAAARWLHRRLVLQHFYLIISHSSSSILL